MPLHSIRSVSPEFPHFDSRYAVPDAASPNALWQVSYRQYDCAGQQMVNVRAPSADDARAMLKEAFTGIGCQVLDVSLAEPAEAVEHGAVPQPRVMSRLRYNATQFSHLGDHPNVQLQAMPRTGQIGYVAYATSAKNRLEPHFVIKPGWWVLERAGKLVGVLSPTEFNAGFEPAEAPEDAGVRAAVTALCREIENEPFALQEPGSSEKRGRLQVLARLQAILAAY